MILSRSAGKEILLQCMRPWFDSWVGKICWRRDRLPTPVFLGFPGGSAGKEPSSNVGDLGLIPGLGRSGEEGNGYPLQYSGLENSMDCIVLGVTKSRTQLSGFHFHLRFFLFLWCQFDFFFISDFIDLDSFSWWVWLQVYWFYLFKE